jgi:hypothetical protein
MAWKIIFAIFGFFFYGWLAALITGESFLAVIGWGILDDILVAVLGSEMTWLEKLALNVAASEIQRGIEQAIEVENETEEEREANARQLRMEHPFNLYLWGQFSVVDYALFAGSAYKVATSETAQTAFQVAGDLLDRVRGIE